MNYTYINQLDALFILSLLDYHTSTCFGRINSPSSGEECIYVANCTCFTSKLAVSEPGWNGTSSIVLSGINCNKVTRLRNV
jgi:hypothetical protein